MEGLYCLIDLGIARGLGVSVETYINIIKKCTEEEAEFIINTIFDEDVENLGKAKEMFNKYLDE
jgi:hypothetical protein